MRGFKIDGEPVAADSFARSRADGGDDQFLAGSFERLDLSFLFCQLHQVITLDGIGDEHHLDLPGQNLTQRMLHRRGVFRESPAIDGHGSDLRSTLLEALQ